MDITIWENLCIIWLCYFFDLPCYMPASLPPISVPRGTKLAPASSSAIEEGKSNDDRSRQMRLSDRGGNFHTWMDGRGLHLVCFIFYRKSITITLQQIHCPYILPSAKPLGQQEPKGMRGDDRRKVKWWTTIKTYLLGKCRYFSVAPGVPRNLC